MGLSLIILLLVIIVFIICFMYIEPIIAKHKVKNNNEYESARFSTKEEINKHFTKENISHIKEIAFPIWYDKDIKHVQFDKETPHYVYLGTSGSGKSVTAVFPMISFIATAKIKRSIFITDPSVFSEKMAIFDDVNVANITSTSDFDFDILGKEKTVLYVIVLDEDKVYYTLVTIIVGLLYKELVKLANSTGKRKVLIEIDWILDEFSNCPP